MIETDTVSFLVYGALFSMVKGWIDRINDMETGPWEPSWRGRRALGSPAGGGPHGSSLPRWGRSAGLPHMTVGCANNVYKEDEVTMCLLSIL